MKAPFSLLCGLLLALGSSSTLAAQQETAPAAPAAKAGPVKAGDSVAWLAKKALKTLEGGEFSFQEWFAPAAQPEQQQQGLLLITFWSHQCPWQNAWDPEIAAIAKEFAPKGLKTVAINSNVKEIENPKGSIEYSKKHELPFPVILDPGNVLADLFGAQTTPHIYLIDAKGKVLYTGAVDNDARKERPEAERQRYLYDAISNTLAGKAVPVADTKPMGCTIKRATKTAS